MRGRLVRNGRLLGAMLRQQWALTSRYPVNLIANFSLVFVAVVVVTLAATLFAAPEAAGALDFGQLTLSGFVIYLFLSNSLWAIGVGVQRERAQGSLESLYLSPASRFLSLVARALVTWAWTAVAAVVGLALAQTIVGPAPFHQPGLALLILLGALGGLLGLSLIFAGLGLLLGESVELLANLVEFGLLGLCAFFFPFGALPGPLQLAARLIPLSYAVDAFRTVLLGFPAGYPELGPFPAELALVLASGVLGPLVGFGLYLLAERRLRAGGGLGG